MRPNMFPLVAEDLAGLMISRGKVIDHIGYRGRASS
jgi:hypothetical protein